MAELNISLNEDEYKAMIARVVEKLRDDVKARIIEEIAKGRSPKEVALEIVDNICDAALGR